MGYAGGVEVDLVGLGCEGVGSTDGVLRKLGSFPRFSSAYLILFMDLN